MQLSLSLSVSLWNLYRWTSIPLSGKIGEFFFATWLSVQAWQRDWENWQGVSDTSTQCSASYGYNADGWKLHAKRLQILTATSSFIWTCSPKVCSKNRLVTAMSHVPSNHSDCRNSSILKWGSQKVHDTSWDQPYHLSQMHPNSPDNEPADMRAWLGFLLANAM